MRILDGFKDLLWPRSCAGCGGTVDRPARYLCSDCLNRLPFVPHRGCCRQCGREVEKLEVEFRCEDCRQTSPAFDRAASALHFDGLARELINAFKFNNATYLRDDLVDFLEAAVRARFQWGEVDWVLPMPSTVWHRLDRGYNQCAYLAAALARRLDRPGAARILKRVGSPARQGGLKEAERRQNVLGTFAVRRPAAVKGRTVLVVDDIMTTGSTLSECAAELKRAGAARVWAVTLARSVRT